MTTSLLWKLCEFNIRNRSYVTTVLLSMHHLCTGDSQDFIDQWLIDVAHVVILFGKALYAVFSLDISVTLSYLLDEYNKDLTRILIFICLRQRGMLFPLI